MLFSINDVSIFFVCLFVCFVFFLILAITVKKFGIWNHSSFGKFDLIEKYNVDLLIFNLLVNLSSAMKTSVEGTTECEICQYAMGYLDSMLKESSTQQEIKQALDSLCGYLPSQYKEQVSSTY